jgi:hypothetical protein
MNAVATHLCKQNWKLVAPPNAGKTWPFTDFHTREGFGAFARENELRRLQLEQLA